MIRVTILTEIPAPFRIPLFNSLAQEVDLTVLYLRERHPARPYGLYEGEWRFSWRVLSGRHAVRGSRWLVLNVGVIRTLRRTAPDAVVLGGWNQPAFWLALAFAKATRKPAIAWVESTERDARSRFWLFERAKHVFLASCDAYLVPGRASAEYLASLGVPPDVVAVAPNAVDHEIFDRRVEAARRERDRLRAELGVAGCCFLSVGRLDREKGIDLLINAIAAVPEAFLLVAGDGSHREELERLAKRAASGRVRFLGFVPRDELVPLYAAADAFALPSRSEQWGMALNEAAAAALPLVASEAAGATHELVEDGVNGFRVPAGDEDALTRAVARLAKDRSFRLAAGERSRERSAHMTPSAWSGAVVELTRRLGLDGSAGGRSAGGCG